MNKHTGRVYTLMSPKARLSAPKGILSKLARLVAASKRDATVTTLARAVGARRAVQS